MKIHEQTIFQRQSQTKMYSEEYFTGISLMFETDVLNLDNLLIVEVK